MQSICLWPSPSVCLCSDLLSVELACSGSLQAGTSGHRGFQIQQPSKDQCVREVLFSLCYIPDLSITEHKNPVRVHDSVESMGYCQHCTVLEPTEWIQASITPSHPFPFYLSLICSCMKASVFGSTLAVASSSTST